MIRILAKDGSYELITPYNSGFVADLKALIPYGQRTYNRDSHTWTVGGKHGQVVQDLCLKHFGERPTLPRLSAASSTLGLLMVYYIGKTRDRGDGSRSAYGWMPDQGTGITTALTGSWRVIFPEQVLKNFFEPSASGQAAPSGNYYEILGLKLGAGDAEIKSAYRRMVRQWHPDVCKDPDAQDVFIRIQKAYEVLSDNRTRARYEAGLRLEAQLPKAAYKKAPDLQEAYRSPLKCGAILCQYVKLGSKYSVEVIHKWDDIYDPQGRILVSSWQKDSEVPTLVWN